MTSIPAARSSLKASAADKGIGVDGCNDDTPEAGGDEGVGAGAGATLMAAGLESDVGGGSLDGETARGGLFEGHDLGVIVVVVKMCAFTQNLVVAGDDAADLRVGARKRDGVGGKVERAPH